MLIMMAQQEEQYQLSKERERRFFKLIEKHRGIIFRVLKSLPFIKEHEYDDYYQEVVIDAWKAFGKWDDFGSGSYSSWLYTATRYKAMRVRSWYRNREHLYYSIPDMATYEGISDMDETPERYKELYEIVQTLPEGDKIGATMFLNGYDYGDIADALGISRDSWQRRVPYIRAKIKSSWLFNFYGLTYSEKKITQGPNSTGYLKAAEVLSKPIHMLSMAGNFIKRYASIRETAADGFNPKAISQILNIPGRTSGGYRWIYEGESRQDILKAAVISRSDAQKKKPVAQYDLEGNYIRTWPSCSATVAAGFDNSKVAAVAKGRYSQHKGYVWKFLDN